jgi:hypothetical protein
MAVTKLPKPPIIEGIAKPRVVSIVVNLSQPDISGFFIVSQIVPKDYNPKANDATPFAALTIPSSKDLILPLVFKINSSKDSPAFLSCSGAS